MTLLASTAGDAAYWALAVFLVAIGLASAFMLFRARTDVSSGCPRSSAAPSATCCP